jgi:chromosome segregation ATPase
MDTNTRPIEARDLIRRLDGHSADIECIFHEIDEIKQGLARSNALIADRLRGNLKADAAALGDSDGAQCEAPANATPAASALIGDLQEQLHHYRQRCGDLRAACEARDRVLVGRDNEIARLRLSNDDLNAWIADHERRHIDLAEVAQRADARADEQAKLAESRLALIRRLEDQVESLKRRLSEADNATESQRLDIEALSGRCDAQRHVIEERDRRIKTLAEELTEANDHRTDQAATIRRLNGHVVELVRALREVRNELPLGPLRTKIDSTFCNENIKAYADLVEAILTFSRTPA